MPCSRLPVKPLRQIKSMALTASPLRCQQEVPRGRWEGVTGGDAHAGRLKWTSPAPAGLPQQTPLAKSTFPSSRLAFSLLSSFYSFLCSEKSLPFSEAQLKCPLFCKVSSRPHLRGREEDSSFIRDSRLYLQLSFQ